MELKIIPLLSIKLSPVDIFWSLKCLNDHITLPVMIGTIAAGTTVPLVAKNRTKPKKSTYSKFQSQFLGLILIVENFEIAFSHQNFHF